MKNTKVKETSKISKTICKAVGNFAMSVWDEYPVGCNILGIYEPEIPVELLLENKSKNKRK